MLTQQSLIDAAVSQLGHHETPPGSNVTTYGQRVHLTPAAWCMQGYSDFAAIAGYSWPQDCQHPGLGFSSVGFFLAWAHKHGYVVSSPLAGDAVCFNWNGDAWPDHVGMFVWNNGKSFVDIEANHPGPDNVGDEVAYQHRPFDGLVMAYVRLPGVANSTIYVSPPTQPVRPRGVVPYPHLPKGVLLGEHLPQHHDFTALYQHQMRRRGWNIGTSGPHHDGVDGIFGPIMTKVTKGFEADKSLPNSKDKHGNWDGIAGPVVYNAAFTMPVT